MYSICCVPISPFYNSLFIVLLFFTLYRKFHISLVLAFFTTLRTIFCHSFLFPKNNPNETFRGNYFILLAEEKNQFLTPLKFFFVIFPIENFPFRFSACFSHTKHKFSSMLLIILLKIFRIFIFRISDSFHSIHTEIFRFSEEKNWNKNNESKHTVGTETKINIRFYRIFDSNLNAELFLNALYLIRFTQRTGFC